MFYAPWCGHCQSMKPDFAEAAEIVQNNWLGLLAAVDATQETDLADKFNVKGYPTIIFFTGDQVTEYTSGRTKDELVGFMHQALYGEEAKEIPVPRRATKDENSSTPFLTSRSIKTLSKNNFTQVINSKAALIMFYNPDSINCQSAKPHFLKAAKTTVAKTCIYGSVDCSQEQDLCQLENVMTFPTFKFFLEGKFVAKFNQSPNFINIRAFVENTALDTIVDDSHIKNDHKMEIKFASANQQDKINKKIKEDL
uniref:Thioredoxin domain-containing protein n=1 Tax=Arion vulgaris TaxID=1028688 RepID=A0A0B6Z522_9EUPU